MTAARPAVLTFGVAHSPVKVQLLASQSLFDLCDTFCRSTPIGADPPEDVYAHLWHVDVPVAGKLERVSLDSGCDSPSSALQAKKVKLSVVQRLAPGTLMQWTYDYGMAMHYTIKFLGAGEMAEDDSESDFPRKVDKPQPAGFQKYEPPAGTGRACGDDSVVNLDAEFPALSKWAFGGEGSRPVKFALFRAGKKTTQNGFGRRQTRVAHCIYLPAAPPKELSEYLHCFNAGSRVQYAQGPYGGPCYTWLSAVVIPRDKATPNLLNKWDVDPQPGFCECVVSDPLAAPLRLNDAFPKVAALAGYRKDPLVKPGYMTLCDNVLRICRGPAKRPHYNGPSDIASVGEDHHTPVRPEGILFEYTGKFTSLQELFCVAEALLRTLGGGAGGSGRGREN